MLRDEPRVAAPADAAVAEPLPEGYYVGNFETILHTARERYEDLLAPAERAFADRFDALSLGARRLYVRLVSRKGPCFRRDRLRYGEIPALGDALGELLAADFADHAESVEASELLGLLLRPELAELAAELLAAPPPAAARKDELLTALAEGARPEELRAAVDRRIEIVRPLYCDHVLVYRLLFFGNLSQDWTELVLRDLGVVRFEAYELRRELRLFPTRAAVDDALELRGIRGEVSRLLWEGELESAVTYGRQVLDGIDRWHPSARRLADRVLSRVGRELERAGEAADALAFYEAAVAPPARERRARVLAGLDRVDEALTLCGEIAAAPRDETEAPFARFFSHRLRRRRGEALAPFARRRRPKLEIEIEPRPGAPVEALVLEHLAAAGRPGFFAENWLWKSLFGLAFWDIVFAPVEGAFQHPFQYGPLDLHSPDFRRARAERVEQRLAELAESDGLGRRLHAVYDAKRGVANRLVAWQEELRAPLEHALEHVTGAQLAAVCDRLSRDLGRYRRGFPDLFVPREGDPGPGEAAFELWEIKAPGDQLRPEQGAWIDYFNEIGVPARVVRVRWRQAVAERR